VRCSSFKVGIGKGIPPLNFEFRLRDLFERKTFSSLRDGVIWLKPDLGDIVSQHYHKKEVIPSFRALFYSSLETRLAAPQPYNNIGQVRASAMIMEIYESRFFECHML